MSYSLGSIYNSTSWAVSKHSLALSTLQEQAATGQEVNRTSDDPYNANRILELRTEGRSIERYINTTEEVISILDFSSSVIQQMTGDGGIGGAWASITSALQPSASPTIRSQKATEIDQVLEEMVSLANKKRMGRYLFGGARSDIEPYLVQRDSSGQITGVTYQGSYEDRDLAVSPGVEMSAVIVGDTLFRSDDPGSPVFYGTTGAAEGTGTHTVRGDIELSVGGSLGAWVLSIDGGATTVTVTGAETNVPVVNASTGEVLYVDATGITQAGTENVRITGTYDIFNILINARDLLKDNGSMDPGIWDQLMDATITSMGKVQEKLVRSYPVIGSRLDTLSNLKTSLEEVQMSTKEEVSRRQDADVAQIAVDLARHEVLYEMSLSVAAKLFSLSLIDFLG